MNVRRRISRAVSSSLSGRRSWLISQAEGFTLVEMLVVVAIIVALAAVIVPTVTIFLSRGEEAARQAEAESVQTAIDAMMADKGLLALTPNETTPTRDFSEAGGNDFDDPNLVFLEVYLREASTAYCYTWDNFGIATQDETAGPEDPCS